MGYYKHMIEGIFGNKTAEKILLHLFHYHEIYAAAIAHDYNESIHPVQRQLERFERAGVLVSKLMGRTRVYRFNPKSPFMKPIQAIVEIAYESIALNDREKLFGERRRPRKKGKVVST